MKKLILITGLFLSIFINAQTPDFHFNGVSIGSFSSDPVTLEITGEAVFYWNTTNKIFRKWDGTSWSDMAQVMFDGIDTTANILLKNPTTFLGETWWSTDEKCEYKAVTLATSATDIWQSICVNYDETNDTFKLPTTQDGQTQNIGQEVFVPAFNDNGTGATALDPKLFIVTGVKSGEENIKTIIKANSSDLITGAIYGINTTSAGIGEYTKLLVYGDANDVNTSAWLVGSELYADTVSGELTDVKPSTQIFPIAKVLKSHPTEGKLFVNTASSPAGNTLAVPAGLDRIHYTADEITLATGTYFLGKRNDIGILGSDTTTAVCPDDTQTPVGQQIVGDPIGFPIEFVSGLYTGQIEFQINTTSGDKRIRLEYYKAANDGTPIDSGILSEPVGVLGVRPALRTISSLLNPPVNTPTFATFQGQLAQNVPLAANERVRVVIICEKVGTVGGDVTFTVYMGNLHSSFTDTPALFRISDNIDVDTSGALQDDFLKLSASNIWLPTTIAESDLPVEAVRKTGTPLNNQLAVFNTINSIEGSDAITYSGTIFNLDVAEVDNSVLNMDITGNVILKGKNDTKIQSDLLISLGDSSNNNDLQVDTVTGDITLNNYGLGIKTGVKTSLLGTTATGKIIEDTNIYLTTTGDGSGLINVDASTLQGISPSGFLRTNAVGIKTSGNLVFNDFILIELGSDTDTTLGFNGVDAELDLMTSNFVIEDNGVDRFIFGRTTGDFEATGQGTFKGSGRVLNLIGTGSGISNDHRLEWYESDATTRQAFVGFSTTGNSDFTIQNTTTGKNLRLEQGGDLTYNGDITATGGINGTYNATLTLSSAQLLNINTTPIEIIPAQGVGKVISITNMVAFYDFGGTAYSGTSALNAVDSETGLINAATVSLLNATADKYSIGKGTAAQEGADNSSIDITAAANPTLGNGTVKISITYEVVDFN